MLAERAAGGAGCGCARARAASPLACLAACCLVLAYNLLGGFLFLALEGPPEGEARGGGGGGAGAPAAGGELRARTVERLWAITEDLNILYKENWTALAAQELAQLERALRAALRPPRAPPAPAPPPPRAARWTFATSFLYALTLITTIGQGEVAPRSAAGRLAALAYAGVGIPIVMLYLATVGGALARALRALYCRARRRPRAPPAPPPAEPRTPFQAALNLSSLRAGVGAGAGGGCERARVPAPLGAALLAGYVALGSLVFRATEKWSFVDGCYFSFSSLATIGFGDLRPGRHASTVSAAAEDVAVAVCCLYILVGMVVVATSFNLIREDASSALRTFSTLCPGSRARAVHGACGDKAAAPPSAAVAVAS